MSKNLYNFVKYILIKYESIDFLRLNFFLYYCQGWALVLRNERLFEEEFIAGVFGPFCRRLFDWFKYTKENNFKSIYSKINPSMMSCPLTISDEDIKFLEEVLEVYDTYTNDQLTNMIRMEFPYTNARKGLCQAEKGNKNIDIEDMKKFFSFQLEIPNWITVKEKFKDFWIVLKLWLKYLIQSK